MLGHLLRLLLVITMSVPTVFVSARETAAANRAPFTRAQLETLFLEAALQYEFYDYQFTGTPEKYAQRMAKVWPESDRSIFLKLTKGMASLPIIERSKGGFTFRGEKKYSKRGKIAMKIEVVDLKARTFRLNGQLFTFIPGTPLVDQLKILSNTVPEQPKEALLRLLLLPDAHAEPVTIATIVTIALTVAVTAIVTTIINNGVLDPVGRMMSRGFCNATENLKPQNLGMCADWEQARREELQKKGVKLDAIEKIIATDKSNVLAKFEPMREYSCPNNNDGKERLYHADVKVKETQAEFTIKTVFTPEGKVKSFSFIDKKTSKVLASLEFNSENYLTCAKIPNPEAERDVLTSANVDLCVSDENTLKPEARAKLQLMKDAALFMNLRATRCTVQAVEEQVARGQAVGSPAQPAPQPGQSSQEPTEGRK